MGALGLAAWWIAGRFDTVSTLVVAVALGLLAGNVAAAVAPGALERAQPGVSLAAKRLLRVGIVVLGLRLSVDEVLDLGGVGLVVVLVTVAATFVGTRWLGRRLGLSDPLSLLTATGYAICGASAIAAMRPNTAARDEEVAVAIGLVTAFGTLSVVALPLIGSALGLDDATFGSWVGAATHDVAQVVAGAATRSDAAVDAAVVVKLTRVAMLAPLVAAVALSARRRPAPGGAGPVLPLFVVGFLGAVAVRSTGLLPDRLLDAARDLETALLAMAMVGLGVGVRLDRLRGLGHRPLVLGVTAWLVVAGVSLVATVAVR